MSASGRPVETVVEVDTRSPGTPISPDLFGVFFEDLNYAADGGLYAELVQNRSFEYGPADHPDWHALTAWELLERDGTAGWLTVSTDDPLHPANPHYAVLTSTISAGAGLRNEGFDGISVRAGEAYDVGVFARLAHGTVDRLVARIESRDGSRIHGRVELGPVEGSWQRHAAVLTCEVTDPDARFTKIANTMPEAVPVRLRLAGVDGDAGFARTTLTVPPDVTSRFGPAPAAPVDDRPTGTVFDIPAHSFTVLRTRAACDRR